MNIKHDLFLILNFNGSLNFFLSSANSDSLNKDIYIYIYIYIYKGIGSFDK